MVIILAVVSHRNQIQRDKDSIASRYITCRICLKLELEMLQRRLPIKAVFGKICEVFVDCGRLVDRWIIL